MHTLNLADSSNDIFASRYASPGVSAVLSVLNETRKNNILDLGRMDQNNADFFARYNCKLFVENISPSLDEINAGADIDEYLLNYGDETKFDAIFTWDIFNYIDLRQLVRLMSRIKKNCRPDTLMHVVTYTQEAIAEIPQHFGLVDKVTVDVGKASTVSRQFPQYSAFDLLSHLPGFIAQDTWLPKDDMLPGAMEYSFRFSPRNLRQVETSGAATKHISREFIDTHKTLHRSPGLAKMLDLLGAREEPPSVLDLGQRIDANVAAFKENEGSVFVENLITSMGGMANNPGGGRTDVGAHTIDYDSTQVFDVVVLWDILNYLQPSQIEQLAEKLRPYCKRGTKLFALSYTHKHMPESPRRFTIGEDCVLSYNDTPDNYKDIPYFTTLDILRRMRNFKIEKTYLFQEGMQSGITELILTYEP